MLPDWTVDAAWPTTAIAAIAVWMRERRRGQRDRIDSQQLVIDTLMVRVASLEGRVDVLQAAALEAVTEKARLEGRLEAVTAERDRLLYELGQRSDSERRPPR